MYWLDQLPVSSLFKIVLKLPDKLDLLSLDHNANQAQESCQECTEDKGWHHIHFVLSELGEKKKKKQNEYYCYIREEISNMPIRSYLKWLDHD